MRKLLLMAAALFAAASPALAADIPYEYPPMTPEVIPLQSTSGWYLRGDIGYKFYNNPDISYRGQDYDDPDLNRTGMIGVGVGYKFNDFLRSDLTLDYEFKSRFDATCETVGCGGVGGSDESGKIDAFTALINGYVDLGTYRGFTPYAGGGIGVSHLRVRDYESDTGEPGNGGKWNFAWALTAGTAYQITDQLSLDVNYRYLNLGDAKTAKYNGDPVKFKNIDAHEIRVGLRYALY